jgi:diaminopimelate epimerase
VGAEAQAWLPGGVNVEVVAPGGDNRVVMRVFERGVGPTEACGTGACAVAWAARHWGLAGDTCTVVMPGGDAEVRLSGDDAELTGPSVLVATLDVPAALLATPGQPA